MIVVDFGILRDSHFTQSSLRAIIGGDAPALGLLQALQLVSSRLMIHCGNDAP
jgi:hypothetical protein